MAASSPTSGPDNKEGSGKKWTACFRASVLQVVLPGGAPVLACSRWGTTGAGSGGGSTGPTGEVFSSQALSHCPSWAARQARGQPASSKSPDHRASSWWWHRAKVKAGSQNMGQSSGQEDPWLCWRWRPAGTEAEMGLLNSGQDMGEACLGHRDFDKSSGSWQMWLKRTALKLQTYTKESPFSKAVKSFVLFKYKLLSSACSKTANFSPHSLCHIRWIHFLSIFPLQFIRTCTHTHTHIYILLYVHIGFCFLGHFPAPYKNYWALQMIYWKRKASLKSLSL